MTAFAYLTVFHSLYNLTALFAGMRTVFELTIISKF